MILVFGITTDTSIFKATLTTVYYVGCLFGAILSKWMERCHRSIVCVDLLFCIGSGLMIFDNFNIFIMGRFITGLGGGIQSVCLGLYLRQFTPTELYSTNAGMLSSIFSIGSAYRKNGLIAFAILLKRLLAINRIYQSSIHRNGDL
ncbi:hypothetical protein pb186bvf_013327 [Paramecium bursaria]